MPAVRLRVAKRAIGRLIFFIHAIFINMYTEYSQFFDNLTVRVGGKG